jgi:hypothetical protein
VRGGAAGAAGAGRAVVVGFGGGGFVVDGAVVVGVLDVAEVVVDVVSVGSVVSVVSVPSVGSEVSCERWVSTSIPATTIARKPTLITVAIARWFPFDASLDASLGASLGGVGSGVVGTVISGWYDELPLLATRAANMEVIAVHTPLYEHYRGPTEGNTRFFTGRRSVAFVCSDQAGHRADGRATPMLRLQCFLAEWYRAGTSEEFVDHTAAALERSVDGRRSSGLASIVWRTQPPARPKTT